MKNRQDEDEEAEDGSACAEADRPRTFDTPSKRATESVATGDG